MRKYLRQIAKARMTLMGVGNVNEKMRLKGEDGVPNWRKAVSGESGEKARRLQTKNARNTKKPKRIIKKVQ